MSEYNKLSKDKKKRVFLNLKKDVNNFEEDSDEMKKQRIDREIKYFNQDFPLFRPFYYNKKEKENSEQVVEEMSIDKSFFMLLLLIIFYILCLYFIYQARSIPADSLIVEFLEKQVSNSNVTDLDSMKVYLVEMAKYFITPNITAIKSNQKSVDMLYYSWSDVEQYLNDVEKAEDNNMTSVNMSKLLDIYYMQIRRINYIPCSSLHFIVVLK
jgi:hypothetical protein